MAELSIVFPAINERKNLVILIPEVEKTFKNFEIIVVDFHSEDGTEELCREMNRKYGNIRVIQRKKLALGHALKEGYKAAKGEIIISSDSDLSFAVKDMERLYKKIREGFDLVIGSRYHKGGMYEAKKFSTKIKHIFSKFGNKIIRNLFNLTVSDFSVNFRAFRKDFLDKIKLVSDDNAILFEMVVKSNQKGFKITEIPVEFRERRFGKSNLRLFREIFKFLFKIIHFYKLRK